jgi:hypothetical protein
MPISGTIFDTSESFNMIADQNDGSGNYSTLIDKEPVSYSNNIWKTTKDYYWSGNSNKTVSFYAYYPTDISKDISHTAGSTPTLLYTVPNDVASQPDIIVASKENVAGNTTMSTDLTFNHIFAAVQFSVGSDGLGSGTISSVSIGDVHDSGTYTFGSGWTLGTSTRTFTISQPETISGTSGEDIYSGTYTLMMIPQTISNATVTVTYSNGSTLTKTISGMWGTGKTYIYNLSYPPRTFSYTGTVQTYKVPVTGTYKLEVWGAQGGGFSETFRGRGGYSYGTVFLNRNSVLYIYVGGQGGNPTYSSDYSYGISGTGFGGVGGYNGGGKGGNGFTGYSGSGGGGGATHIAAINGLLNTLSSNKSAVLIVAGGGGGGSFGEGGPGGGENGVSATFGTYTSIGGGQLSGYQFGQGQDGYSKTSFGNTGAEGNGGGGGGWYGGYACQTGNGDNTNVGGGGGSGYIDSGVTGVTIAGNVSFTDYDGTTVTGHSGNGYARITFISAN